MTTEPISTPKSVASWNALAHAAAGAPVGLILLDRDGGIVFANSAALALMNQRADQVLGRPAAELFDSDDVPVREALVGCVTRGEAFRKRMTVQPVSGSAIDCDLAVYRVQEGGGEAYHVLWINDVTEHVAMQRSLLQAERLSALGEIVAGVAHELNNPLTGILGYAQLLLNDDFSPKVRQRLEHIVTEAMRCQAIVQSLRGFSSHAATEQALHDANQIVDNMVTLLEYQMRVDGIEVTRQFTGDMPLVLIDAHELGRAILNIVHNAHQALELVDQREREFMVLTEADEHQISLCFRDNGPGIRQEHLSRIFDPFFTTREFGKGVGLGLSVAYGVVREHGGRIDVSSKPGDGAEFIIRLPRPKTGD